MAFSPWTSWLQLTGWLAIIKAPEERLLIAQRFSAGKENGKPEVPEGTTEILTWLLTLGATSCQLEHLDTANVLRFQSPDATNRLTRACVLALTEALKDLTSKSMPLIITGNPKFFSAGADLSEIASLTAPEAYHFAQMGQELMNAIAHFPAPVYAAIEGYCMGGGLDLALACHHRIASPHAIFGHRGAALGLVTGWGGTQRLPRLVGKGKALQLFVCAQKLHAADALRVGLIDGIADDPVHFCISQTKKSSELSDGMHGQLSG